MSSIAEGIASYAQEKRLSAQTLQRWQSWSEEDQSALFPLARELQLNENQLRDFLDWLEEIVARDGVTVRDVLARTELQRPLEARLSRNDKLKAVKETLRKIRYPRLSQLEDDLRAAIKALDLGNRVRVSFPAALEGNEITLEIKTRNIQEIRDSLTQLQQKLEDGSLQRVFELLDEV
jgi:hypothetical protein